MYPDQGQAYYEDVPPGHTQPYQAPPGSLRFTEPVSPSRRSILWLAITCIVVSFAALGITAAALLMPKPVDRTTAREIAQIQRELSSTQQALTKALRANASLVDRLSAVEGGMATLAPFTKTCSQYLTGPNGGPTTFYMPCTDQRPG